jgi:hypothetical protein
LKSLAGIELQSALIAEFGCLLHVYEMSLPMKMGILHLENQISLFICLQSQVDFEKETIIMRTESETECRHFYLKKEKLEIQSFLADYFVIQNLLLQN